MWIMSRMLLLQRSLWRIYKVVLIHFNTHSIEKVKRCFKKDVHHLCGRSIDTECLGFFPSNGRFIQCHCILLSLVAFIYSFWLDFNPKRGFHSSHTWLLWQHHICMFEYSLSILVLNYLYPSKVLAWRLPGIAMGESEIPSTHPENQLQDLKLSLCHVVVVKPQEHQLIMCAISLIGEIWG